MVTIHALQVALMGANVLRVFLFAVLGKTSTIKSYNDGTLSMELALPPQSQNGHFVVMTPFLVVATEPKRRLHKADAKGEDSCLYHKRQGRRSRTSIGHDLGLRHELNGLPNHSRGTATSRRRARPLGALFPIRGCYAALSHISKLDGVLNTIASADPFHTRWCR